MSGEELETKYQCILAIWARWLWQSKFILPLFLPSDEVVRLAKLVGGEKVINIVGEVVHLIRDRG